MKTVFVLENITIRGGVEKATSTLANAFILEGLEVEILSLYSSAGTCPFELNENVRITHLSLNSINNVNVMMKLLRLFFNGLYLKKILAQRKDTFIFQGAYSSFYVPFLWDNQSNIICCEHNDYTRVSSLTSALRWISYKLADRSVSITQNDYQILQSKFKNAVLIPNPILVPVSVHAGNQCERLIFVGRFSDQKNPEEAVYIADEILTKHENLKFFMFGNGPLENSVLDKIKNSKNASQMALITNETDVSRIFTPGSLMVMTSLYEGLPMSILEAEASGVPVVAYDCSKGMRDCLVDGVSGYLVVSGNSHAMIDIIHNIVKDQAKYQELSSGAQKLAMKFSIPHIIGLWKDLLRDLS